MAHDHSHHHHEVTGKNISTAVILNAGITIAQIIGGLLSGSLSLLSDALHNFSDVLSLLFSWIAHRYSKKQATAKSTFGYKRAEVVAAFVNATALVIVAALLLYEAIVRFSNPVSVQSEVVIWLSIVGIVFNGFSALLLKNDAEHNLNMKSAYLHLFSDMLASVAVLVGGILMHVFNWFWIDSVITILIAIYLIYMSFDLIKASTKMLMLFTPENLDITEIVNSIHKVTGIHRLHHIHLWHLNDHELHFEAHLDCKENISITDFNLLVTQIELVLRDQFHISHSTIQPEFEKACAKEYIVQD